MGVTRACAAAGAMTSRANLRAWERVNRFWVVILGAGLDRHLDADEVVGEVAAELA
jgi:hypothetical protein